MSGLKRVRDGDSSSRGCGRERRPRRGVPQARPQRRARPRRRSGRRDREPSRTLRTHRDGGAGSNAVGGRHRERPNRNRVTATDLAASALPAFGVEDDRAPQRRMSRTAASSRVEIPSPLPLFGWLTAVEATVGVLAVSVVAPRSDGAVVRIGSARFGPPPAGPALDPSLTASTPRRARDDRAPAGRTASAVDAGGRRREHVDRRRPRLLDRAPSREAVDQRVVSQPRQESPEPEVEDGRPADRDRGDREPDGEIGRANGAHTRVSD